MASVRVPRCFRRAGPLFPGDMLYVSQRTCGLHTSRWFRPCLKLLPLKPLPTSQR